MKRILLLLACIFCGLNLMATKQDVSKVRHIGPFVVNTPYMVDSLDVNSKAYDYKSILSAQLSTESLKSAPWVATSSIENAGEQVGLNVLEFFVENTKYIEAKVEVGGLSNYEIYLDGKKNPGKSLSLTPATHSVQVKFLSESSNDSELSISIESKGEFSLREDGKHLFTLNDVLSGKKVSSLSISPDGTMAFVQYSVSSGKTTSYYTDLLNLKDGGAVSNLAGNPKWMPRSSKYYVTEQTVEGRDLVSVDPKTFEKTVLAKNLPSGNMRIAPSEDYLLYSFREDGPRERSDIYEVLTPDDRQRGWRSRTYLAKYDIATGLMQRLTFGHSNTHASDISRDGSKILMMVSTENLESRPTSRSSLYILDVNTLQTELLVEEDGFINSAVFSPDGKQILISGSPECLGGIGLNVKPGQTPNIYDVQLYLMDLETKKIKALTKNFDPSVGSLKWADDGNVYFTAEDKDCINLFKLNPRSGRIVQIPVKEDLVESFSVSADASVLLYSGESASNADRIYKMYGADGKSIVVDDLSAVRLANVGLGECVPWSFKSTRGDKINARYYLPPAFDPQKKYPLIVNYYGGCSPTSRTFESRYPHHAYAALGYVVLVINPSGATGFGQEFSARHVNTAGKGPAEDIIDGTKAFCEQFEFVDASKIGCIGASYGGFMTQYLQTQTDIFAAAISHAGISDHTSYWGEGYWGYSYSEVSMANSYPWSHKELYVDQSPLYNADKINTPILFLHGDSDTNVPVGESIQMYTALKLLGKETAMVLVKDQDHHITQYDQRVMWQNTIFAWFAKWLQDDPTWWNKLYAPKTL